MRVDPMMVGVGAIATNEVLRRWRMLRRQGGCVITADDVLSAAFRGGDLCLYEEVCRHVSVPVCL